MNHLSQSGAGVFRDCRKMAHLRYELGIYPKEEDAVLSLGKLFHKSLEIFYLEILNGCDGPPASNWRDRLREILTKENPKQPTYIDVTIAMMARYLQKYDDHIKWEVVGVEVPFSIPLINPDTGAASRSFVREGKLDLLIRKKNDGTVWLVEHKSSSRIDSAYLRRLWLDFQITWYLEAAEKKYGIKIAGIIYNMIEKPQTAKLVPGVGETEAEFADRCKELKNPKAAKRKLPETREDYLSRIDAFYDDPTVFSREEILLTREDIDLMLQESWDIGQAWLDARLKNRWYRNTSNCFKWNKPCQYLPICQSRDNPAVIEASYEVRKKVDDTKAF
jgi:hypothetical protein